VNDLEFMNLGGIEYAFYCTQDADECGYMRFQPLQQRGMTQNKSNSLVSRLNCCAVFYLLFYLEFFQRFIVLHGHFKIESSLRNSASLNHFILNPGDMFEIKPGASSSSFWTIN